MKRAIKIIGIGALAIVTISGLVGLAGGIMIEDTLLAMTGMIVAFIGAVSVIGAADSL